MDRDLQNRIAEGQELIEKLLSGPKYFFCTLKPTDIPEAIAGVYAIFDKNTGEVLYVGRTKNLRRRLYTNHLHGPKANARLKKYLTEDNDLPDISSMEIAKLYLKENCYAQYIVGDNIQERGRIEGFISFVFNVRYIHEEH